MESTLVGYREDMAAKVRELSLHETNWTADGWKQLWAGVTQDVLNDAFKQHGLVRSIFSDLGEITQRSCKSLERVQKKMAYQPAGKENFFRVVSDFVAVRVPCQVPEIQGKIDRIRKAVLDGGGLMRVRGSSEKQTYGSFIGADGRYADIIQYVYVFLEKVAYPIEFQIGHKFASHTFSINSALRDNPTCGKVRLWSINFYNDVKQYLLNKSNGEKPGSKEALLSKARDLHQGSVPEELSAILEEI